MCGERVDKEWEGRGRGCLCINCFKIIKANDSAKYYKNNKTRLFERRKGNPEKVKLAQAKKDFGKRNAKGTFTAEEWKDKLEEYNYRCAYCGCELNTDTITIDHDIPIARGGTNCIKNLIPACHSCNSRKHTRTAKEYLAILSR